MTLLTAADLAYTRATQGQSLTDTAIVEHRSWVEDGMGNANQVTTGYTDNVPCRVAPLRVQAGEQLVGGQLQAQLPWHITLPAGQPIEVDDRVHVGSTLTGTPPNQTVTGGRAWEVLALYAAWTLETARQCLCVER